MRNVEHSEGTTTLSRATHPALIRHTSAHCYTWAERDALFKAAAAVTLDEAGDFPFSHFLGLLMLAGMRTEEALLMRWEPPRADAPWPWPDMKAWQINVPDSGPRGKRCVPIIPQLARLLSYWPTPKKGLLFPFRVTSHHISECWRQTVQTAGVKPVSIHSLQNTYAVMMQDVFGLSPYEVGKILGQPSVSRRASSSKV